jgi:hypothetical protein
MATTEFTLTDADVGKIIGPSGGFLVNLSRVSAGPFDPPSFDPGKRIWTAGRLVLKGTLDHRDLVCCDSQSGGGVNGLGYPTLWVNSSIGYHGQLMIVCIPRQSVWALTLSDQPYVRTVESFDSYIARISNAGSVSRSRP